MRRLSFLLLCAVLAFGLCGCTATVTSTPVGTVMEDGSVYLGFTLVSRKKDKDWMLVGEEHGYFNGLRFNVKDRPLQVQKMVVTFGTGEEWTAPVKGRFTKGSWSEEITFPGARTIRKVTFHGRAQGKKAGMAKVSLYGRR
jgi:hypothetical protein